MQKTVAELLVATLHEIGVRQIFGVVGDALNPLTDAIRRHGGMQWIGVRHEEGAALAAAGQAKLTGKLAVCCGTTGPGANHLIAGLYEAHKDHAPVLAISGGVPATQRGNDYLQENTPDLLFRDVTVYTQTLANPDQASHVFHQAIAHAYGMRGVSHLNIPPEVFAAKTGAKMASLATLRESPEMAADPKDVTEAVRLIGHSANIAIFAGAGCRSAIPQVLQLAERLQSPIMHTFRAKDMVAYNHPHWIGGVGLIGGAPGVDALQDAELVLMLGSDYPYTEFLPENGKVIQIDLRPEVLGRRTGVQLGIVGAIKPTITQLLEQLPQRKDGDFLQKVTAARKKWDQMLDKKALLRESLEHINPQALVRGISRFAQSDATFIVDTGIVTLWCGNWLQQSGQQRILASFNNAAVGTSLGQANGVQALNRDKQVIVAVGDGGFTMLLGEFMTSVEHHLPVKVIVFNNKEWGLVHLEMEVAGLPAHKGSKFPNIDFAAFAKACGVSGFTVQNSGDLESGLNQLFAVTGPAVLNVFIDPAELPSMPHIHIDQVWRFGLARVKEAILSIRDK
ncbi:thiamine pyrophosphate-binding protein [Solimicrobium silvestre]|uniref:Thiamine pyrophosphate-requiring enzyme n=1 Tax=Solimicrobium silvestre TaxID=2099400 RepID=A0A2S9GXK6_9BURK|nr:thiamine pyrophosphate-binding protein [Solimicrobium silvestre]PRC92452.1 Thiamine pyrophosphate-requiring enzyme [Solimicrobium silvestre]